MTWGEIWPAIRLGARYGVRLGAVLGAALWLCSCSQPVSGSDGGRCILRYTSCDVTKNDYLEKSPLFFTYPGPCPEGVEMQCGCGPFGDDAGARVIEMPEPRPNRPGLPNGIVPADSEDCSVPSKARQVTGTVYGQLSGSDLSRCKKPGCRILDDAGHVEADALEWLRMFDDREATR